MRAPPERRVVHRLRQDCPWDQDQTHASLRKYLVEESYEVLDAIDQLVDADDDDVSAAYADLEEELGDLLFQVLFHAELAAEAGEFGIADVARTMHDKLVGRHPHVFGDVVANDAAAVVANWEAIKKVEKQRSSIMDGIPRPCRRCCWPRRC
ncbi:MAG: MazG nucleotide pyrophosphohydrolase domain-containing protein [Acidimicrobiales bacterium]